MLGRLRADAPISRKRSWKGLLRPLGKLPTARVPSMPVASTWDSHVALRNPIAAGFGQRFASFGAEFSRENNGRLCQIAIVDQFALC